MNRIRILLMLLPMIQAVKIKVPRESEKSIVNLNKGPVLYPSTAKQTMATTSSSTTTSGKPPSNSTYVYQKGFLPIPMATLETTTARHTKLHPVQQQERRAGYSTPSQEIDEQVTSTQEVKLAKYEIDEHQESYEGHIPIHNEQSYKGHIPIQNEESYRGHFPILNEGSYKGHFPLHTNSNPFSPELTGKQPPFKFESAGVEDQVENNEIIGNHHYQYGDFKEYQFPEDIQEHQLPKGHHMQEHHMQELPMLKGHHHHKHHMPAHNMQENHMPKKEHKEPPHDS